LSVNGFTIRICTHLWIDDWGRRLVIGIGVTVGLRDRFIELAVIKYANVAVLIEEQLNNHSTFLEGLEFPVVQ
jgi:hypothetical protein